MIWSLILNFPSTAAALPSAILFTKIPDNSSIKMHTKKKLFFSLQPEMILLTAKEDKLIIIIIHTHFVKCNVVQCMCSQQFS